MSLRLEKFEELLNRFSESKPAKHPVQFCYSKEYLELKEFSDKIDARISSGTYSDKVTQKAKNLVSQWNDIQKANPSPPVFRWAGLKPSHSELVKILSWTLEQNGFTLVSESSSADLVCRSFKYEQTEAQLRVIAVSKHHTVVYLNSYRFACEFNTITPNQIPLRFQLSCIFPLTNKTQQPKLESIPMETMTRILTFLSIDEMGSLLATSHQIQASFESDLLWQEIWNSFERYLKGQKPIGLTLHPGEHKAVIANLVEERQKRREARFVQSLALSDWSTPTHFIDRSMGLVDPVREIRRRRMDVIGDPFAEPLWTI